MENICYHHLQMIYRMCNDLQVKGIQCYIPGFNWWFSDLELFFWDYPIWDIEAEIKAIKLRNDLIFLDEQSFSDFQILLSTAVLEGKKIKHLSYWIEIERLREIEKEKYQQFVELGK